MNEAQTEKTIPEWERVTIDGREVFVIPNWPEDPTRPYSSIVEATNTTRGFTRVTGSSRHEKKGNASSSD